MKRTSRDAPETYAMMLEANGFSRGIGTCCIRCRTIDLISVRALRFGDDDEEDEVADEWAREDIVAEQSCASLPA